MISPRPAFKDDIILVAGAGVSNYLGLRNLDTLPQLTDLTAGDDEVIQLIQQTWSHVKAKRGKGAMFEEAIGQLKEYLAAAELMKTDPVFQQGLTRVPNEIQTGSFSYKWRDALTRSYRVILSEYGPKKVRSKVLTDFQDELHTLVFLLSQIAHLNGGELVLYTTNYDCLWQVLSSTTDTLSFVTHINNEDGSFREMWYSSRADLDDETTPRIYVNRLHGCVGWFDDLRTPFRVGEVYGAGEDIEIQDDEKIKQMAIKLVTSHDIGTQPAFRHAFDEFQHHLHSSKALLVWGHRFRDKEVVRKIVEASTRRDDLPCYYINPYQKPGEVVDQVRDTLLDVPVPSVDFRPNRIEWHPRDGHESLVNRTIDCLKQLD